MNTNKFIETAINNPDNRATASRFRLAGRTIWLKTDPKDENETADFQPIISNMTTFLVMWPFSSWGMDVSSRTQNLLKDLREKVRRAWAWDMANEHGSPEATASTVSTGSGSYNQVSVKYPDSSIPVNPVPVLQMDRRYIKSPMLKVKTPNAEAVKMLLLGKNPENSDFYLQKWFEHLDPSECDTPEELKEQERLLPANYINPCFEKSIRSLAFGTVKKENTMKVMANSLGQMKKSLDRHTDSMVGEMQLQASRNFAPPSMEESGLYKSAHDVLSAQLAKLKDLSLKVSTASEVFYRVLTFPDSAYPTVRMDVDGMWSHGWRSHVGDLKISRYTSTHVSDSECTFSDNIPTFKLDLTRGFSLVDVNPKSFNYYWVRRNFYQYRQVLSSIGLHLAYPMGQAPSEWDYEDMAVPYFLSESDS